MIKSIDEYWIGSNYDGDFLVFNTFSKRLLHLNSITTSNSKELQLIHYENLPKSVKDSIGINLDNKNSCFDLKAVYKKGLVTDCSSITINLGFDCNLRCTYCYEKREKLGNHSDKMSKYRTELSSFISHHIEENNIDHLSIEFYGGEPFVYFNDMVDIAVDMNKVCKSKNINFTFSIMTNGTLIDNTKIEQLMNLGLWKIEVSLDGNSQTHKRMRPLSNGENSYELILKNLSDIKQPVRIVIRVNVDESTFGNEAELFEDIKNYNLDNKVEIYFTSIIGCENKCTFDNSAEFYKKLGDLYINAAKSELNLALEYYALGPCHIYKKNSFGVNPNGDIYSCFSLEETKRGNIINIEKISYNSIDERLDSIYGKCGKCEYLPICFGGCEYQNKNDGFLSNCPKKVFDGIVPRLMHAKKIEKSFARFRLAAKEKEFHEQSR